MKPPSELSYDERFNPTLVRLRLVGLGLVPLRPAWFQSHAGSIEAKQKGAESL